MVLEKRGSDTFGRDCSINMAVAFNDFNEKEQNGKKSAMDILPEEIRHNVWKLLQVKDLARASQVSQFWRDQAFNPSLWRDLYFERFPSVISDADFKQRVGDGWRTRFAYMKPHATMLKINTIKIVPKIRNYIEEVLISPSALKNGQLFINVDGGFFGRLKDHFSSLQKNPLFNVFSYDLYFATRWQTTSFSQEVMKSLNAAKMEGKKLLLLLHDLDKTMPGLNPIIREAKLMQEAIQLVNRNKEDIILFGYTKAIELFKPPLIELFATHCTIVEIKRPDKHQRKIKILQNIEAANPIHNTHIHLHLKLDEDAVAEHMEGLTLDAIDLLFHEIVIKSLSKIRAGLAPREMVGPGMSSVIEFTMEELGPMIRNILATIGRRTTKYYKKLSPSIQMPVSLVCKSVKMNNFTIPADRFSMSVKKVPFGCN